jgi:hypothetical protein
MDYLHGDVVDNEFAAACCYEYAREWDVPDGTDDAMTLEKELLRRIEQGEEVFGRLEEGEGEYKIRLPIEDIFRCGWSLKGYAWTLIRQCPSFPQKNWNQLSKEERTNILLGFVPSTEIEPLPMDEVWLLDTGGIFDELKTMASKVLKSKRPRKPQRKVYPIVERCSPYVHAMFTLDFRKTKKRLLQEFDRWLRLPENRARFRAQGRKPTGKTGLFKDRLKDLAAWRLYRELGCEEALAFAEKNRKRDKHGRPLQFHDARQGQTIKTRLNEAPLYSEESGFLKAKQRAIEFLEVIEALASFQYGVPRHVEVI